jgi:hypothetical protein
MIGNDRLYLAVRTLATAEGDARARVCIAMLDVDKISPNEFKEEPHLWKRIEWLKKETSKKGKYIENGRLVRDMYENTALMRKNKTYKKYAEEIIGIWFETCE